MNDTIIRYKKKLLWMINEVSQNKKSNNKKKTLEKQFKIISK